MKNVVAALNSSIQFNKKNFWIDPVSHNQYFVGVQYPEEDIDSVDTLLDVPITSPVQKQADPAAEHRLAAPRDRADGDHPHQPAADDRPDDGRLTAATWATWPTTWPRSSPSSASRRSPTARGCPYDPDDHSANAKPIEGSHDRAQRRVLADAGHVPQPGLRA